MAMIKFRAQFANEDCETYRKKALGFYQDQLDQNERELARTNMLIEQTRAEMGANDAARRKLVEQREYLKDLKRVARVNLMWAIAQLLCVLSALAYLVIWSLT